MYPGIVANDVQSDGAKQDSQGKVIVMYHEDATYTEI
jgi:hypothetical protein